MRKPYPVECKGYIKATKIKKSINYHVDHFLQYVIQESSEHTCTTPLSPLCGSRFVPYSIPKISQSIHHIMKNEPSMNSCQIGNLFKPGNSLSDESHRGESLSKTQEKVSLGFCFIGLLFKM